MAHISKNATIKFCQLRERLEELLVSPLSGLARQLLNLLDNPDHRGNIDHVSKIFERLPKEFDDNFYFNAWMIQSIIKEWSSEIIPYSSRIIPIPNDIWGLQWILIPTFNANLGLFLVYIPFDNDKQIPSILDYPFLCHELGHYLLLRHNSTFQINFLPYLENKISELKRMSISDRGDARKKSQKNIDELNTKWNFDPKSNISSWSREIAVDMIALWTSGPAYLETFLHHHKNISDPFYIETEHPPVELRIFAIIQAAMKLKWENFARSLVKINQNWQNKISVAIRNRYNSLRCQDLIETCIKAAFVYCEFLKLPCLKSKDLSEIVMRIEQNEEISDGFDLILRAWLIYKEKGEEFYNKWEEQTVKEIVNEIRQ